MGLIQEQTIARTHTIISQTVTVTSGSRERNSFRWFKQYLFRIKYMGIYTMSCETGSDIKHKAFVKVFVVCSGVVSFYFVYKV